MELFLNILWALIVLACASIWRMRWARQARNRQHDAWRQWTAFACAMVLLFFVVSLTDDLHAELLFFEECSTSRRHASCLACPHHSSHDLRTSAARGFAVLPDGPTTKPLAFNFAMFQTSQTSQPFLTAKSSSGRDPPVFVL
jgi:hypothetical protein